MSGRSMFKPISLPARLSPAERLRFKTMREGGATTNDVGEDVPVKRYVYNPGPTVASVPFDAPREQHSAAIREARRKGHVGTWRNDSGSHDYDPSASTESLEEAEAQARKHRQHAVYDTKTGKDVVVCGRDDYRCQHHGG